MNTKKLQSVLEYGFTPEEVRAFKIACIWEDLTRKMFPDEKGIARLPKSGDPRKSSLFKFCWKMRRETKGLLKDEEYILYVKANLTVVKMNNLYLSPNVLCGDNAWIRWKIWKKLYDKKLQEINSEQPVIDVQVRPEILRKMELTKRFLFEKCDGKPTFEKIQAFYDDHSLHLWAGGKIAYLYLLLSPWIEKIVSIKMLERELSFDSKVYQDQIDDSMKIYFRQTFGHEFGDPIESD